MKEPTEGKGISPASWPGRTMDAKNQPRRVKHASGYNMDISPIFGIGAEKSAAFCIIGMHGSGNNHWDFSLWRPSVTGFMHSISHKHKSKNKDLMCSKRFVVARRSPVMLPSRGPCRSPLAP